MKKIARLAVPLAALVLCVVIFLKGPVAEDGRSALYQVSVIGALMQGDYEGEVTVGTLKAHGDLGIGTFDGLDGEMVELGGVVYQVKSDGSTGVVDDRIKTPFAMATFFDADSAITVTKPLGHEKLLAVIDKLASNRNIPYAVKIEGIFREVKTRSVARQEKPYRPLTEVVKEQSVFNFNNIEGTIVGFLMPRYMEGLDVPGSHLHFLSADKRAGGHLLNCALVRGTVTVDPLYRFDMALPRGNGFARLDLTAGSQRDIEKVEKDK